MPSTRHVEFPPVNVGAGLRAVAVSFRRGPVVLIEFSRPAGYKGPLSRLDTQKRVFIDPVPGEPTDDGITRLVSTVNQARAG